MEPSKIQLKRLFLFVFLSLLALLGVFFFVGYRRGIFESPEAMQDYLQGAGSYAPLLLTAIQTMQAFFPIIPSFFGFVVGASLFGAIGGFLCNYIGISLGSIIAYLLARKFGITFVQQIIPQKKYDAAVNWALSKKSYTVVFALSILLPLAPDCILCYFSGLIQMPIRKYLTIILAAKPWCILFYSILFSNLF